MPKAKKQKDPERQRIGKLSRTKGHSFERDVANVLKEIFPDARRHLEYQDGECYGVDLVNTGAYKVQCKRGRKYASFTAIKEIQCDELMGDVPVLVTRADSERPLVALPLDEFVRLLTLVKRFHR